MTPKKPKPTKLDVKCKGTCLIQGGYVIHQPGCPRFTKWCLRCELSEATRGDECYACSKHRQRHGEPRTQELIDRQIDRYFRPVYG